MKPDDAIESITKYFNDIISDIVPASVWALGIITMHFGFDSRKALPFPEGALGIFCVIGILFASGHLLHGVFDTVFKRIINRMPFISRFDEAGASKKASFQIFQQYVQSRWRDPSGANQAWEYRDLRSVAMSTSPSAESLGRRFMFISLLCNGTGTALALLAVQFMAISAFAPNLLHAYALAFPFIVQVALLVIASWLFFERGVSFHARAMSTPFAVAVGEISFNREARHD